MATKLPMKSLPIADARKRLSYNSETGVFTWLKSLAGRVRAGEKAGTVSPEGYLKIGVCNRILSAHHLAWLFTYGVWPSGEIDHINGVRLDNRIANLRCVSKAQNSLNRNRYKSNTSGYKGVYRCNGSWHARISVQKQKIFLGAYADPTDAAEAYDKASRRYHGEFGRPNSEMVS